MLKQLFTKRLLIVATAISMALYFIVVWQTVSSYADNMPTTTLKQIGANKEATANWELMDENKVYQPYALGTPVDRLIGSNGPYWSLLTTELAECGPVTKISLSKVVDDTLIEVDYIEAENKTVGLQASDFENHIDTEYGEEYDGLSEDHLHPADSSNNAYYVCGFGTDEGTWLCKRTPKGTYFEIQGPYSKVKDNYDHVITIYFNKAEELPPTPEEVQDVIDLINAIGDVTLESEDAIATAREAYDKLSEEYKAKIDEDKLKKLTDAERTLKEIKAKPVKEAIAALPKASELTLNDKAAVEAARVAYDALSSEAKEYVDNITTLELAEATIAKLEAQAELAQAKEKLNEALENAEPEDDIDKLAEQVSKAKEDLEKAEQELKNLKDEKAAAKLTVSGLKVTSKIKKFTVTWKKNAKADGYQVQYKLKSAKKFSTLKTLAKTKVVSKKLKKGKMYQFKVRTYKTVNGTKVYGKWSPIKTCKCK